MSITLDGTAGVVVSGNTNTLSGITVGRGAGSVATNTAVGASALAANTTGAYNTVLGSESGLNTTSSSNTLIGQGAGKANTTGSLTAVGDTSLVANTTGTSNSALGIDTLAANTTGSSNTAVGRQALRFNTTASNNTAVGYQAGYANTTGTYNTFVGYRAGYSMTTNSTSTMIGQGAGYNTTGATNTFVGQSSGYYVTTGASNTIIGGFTGNGGGLDIRTASNYIVLSDGDGNPWAWRNANYSFAINSTQTASELLFAISGVGKASVYWDNTAARLYTYTNTNGPYVANGGTSWTNSSDERMKNITGEIKNGLSKVCSLRAAEYTWKADELAKPQVGLIAQDVLAVLPEAVEAPEEGTLDKDGNPAMMGVQYTNVIPLLVAAIKELKAEIDVLKGQA